MADEMNHPITTDDEAFERGLNRHRGDEQRRARADASARLRTRGIDLLSDEPMEAVVELLEAVEAFEHAVEARGGDLMVDSPPSDQPDDPRFVLPTQRAGEPLLDLAHRIRNAAQLLLAARAD